MRPKDKKTISKGPSLGNTTVVVSSETRKSVEGTRMIEKMLSTISEAEIEVLAGYPHGNVKQFNPRVLIISNSRYITASYKQKSHLNSVKNQDYPEYQKKES